ncbi:VTC domain-containing protein [Roseinatronobacter monicus]|uniref:VTC domain-containing protein n=1 Tax=Roseinatronobacter monicus TaxID=393481 RepID=UPI003F2C4B0B
MIATRRNPSLTGCETLHAFVAEMDSIGLEECSTIAAGRFDRKFVFPISELDSLVQELRRARPDGQAWRVLEVDGQRATQYHTVYFDTPCLQLYRDHLQGRRRRYKIRARRYSTGAHMLEIKLKGSRGQTEKLRRARWDGTSALHLEHAEESWLHASLLDCFSCSAPEGLRAAAQTFYRRICLVGPDGARLTIDLDFAVAQGALCTADDLLARKVVNPGLAIIEIKSAVLNTSVERQLRRIVNRPDRLSKYAVALALTRDVHCNPWVPALRRLNALSPMPEGRGALGHV